MKILSRSALLVCALLALAGCVATAQKKDSESSLQCRDLLNHDRIKNHCEIKEQTLPATGSVNVDGKRNGGVSIKGWDRNEVLLRYRVQTAAPSQAEADQLAREIRVETNGHRIQAEGPEERDNYHWYVTYEVFVPRRTNLSLEARNGGISISDVYGKIDFSTTNGGVSLRKVGGAVRGSTTNGGVHVELSGDRWNGEELNVRTTNGGVNLSVPENYSAHLETGTDNGNVSFDFPVNVALTQRGRMPKNISVYLGSGGPPVRVTTTNGGVRVTRPASGN